MPKKIRDGLIKSFDRVAAWAVEVRKGRLEARTALREAQKGATEAAERIVASAEQSAAQLMQEARQRDDEWTSKDTRVKSYHSFVELLKEKLKLNLGEDGYQQVAKSVNAVWETHPDNLNRPAPKPVPVESIYSGPSGP